MSIKILILEDEPSIRSFIKIKLKHLNYDITTVECGKDALSTINGTFNIALLDIMLPDMSGLQVCKTFRNKFPNLGIIMLTAKGQESDKIQAFKNGADDYIVKPFSPSELAARIKSLSRRLNISSQCDDNCLESGPFKLDLSNKSLYKNNELIPLTPTEFSILLCLIKNHNKTLSRDFILNDVWGINYIGDIKIVDVNVRRLRQKIESDPSSPCYLTTCWGYGYMWCNENV